MCVVRGRSSSPTPKSRMRSATSTKSKGTNRPLYIVTSKLPGPSNQSQQVIRKASAVCSRFMDDLPSKSQIFDHWKDRLPGLGITIHWRQPGCWTCGFHYGARYGIKRPDTSWHEILRCWDNIPLQRCLPAFSWWHKRSSQPLLDVPRVSRPGAEHKHSRNILRMGACSRLGCAGVC
jgi:hypothetical protein